MLERLDRLVREKLILGAWLCLVFIYLAKEMFLLLPSLAVPAFVVAAVLAEETLWIVLQPLAVLVYPVRHWRAMSGSQKLARFSSFWLPVALLVAVFLKKVSVVMTYGLGGVSLAKYDLVLEVLWVYFPVAGTLSWYMRRWRHASPGEKWRCQNLFLPVVGTLYVCLLARVCMVVLFDFSLQDAGQLVFDDIEEVLSVVHPGLGLWAEHQSRRERVAHVANARPAPVAEANGTVETDAIVPAA